MEKKSVTSPSGSKLEHLSIPIALLQSTGLQFRRNLLGVVFNENASGNSRDLFDHYYYLLQPRSNIVAHRSYLFFSFCSAISDCWATEPYIYYKCTLPVAKFPFFTSSNWVFFQKLMEVCDNLKFMWWHFQNTWNELSKRDGVMRSGSRQLSTASILVSTLLAGYGLLH